MTGRCPRSSAFWSAVWDFCRVIARDKGDTVLEPPGSFSSDQPPGARWFPGATLNFAENLLRYRDDQVALVSLLETGRRQTLTYGELYPEGGRAGRQPARQGV